MAVAKINRIEVIGLQEDKEAFLGLLQQLGIVEVIKAAEEMPAVSGKPAGEADILEIEETLGFLSTFKEKTGLLEGMASFKPIIYRKELNSIISAFDHHAFLKNVSGLRDHLKNLIQRKEKLDGEKLLLMPWKRLSIPLDQLRLAKKARVELVICYTRDYQNIIDNFGKEGIGLFHEIIHKDRANTYAVLVYLEKDFEKGQMVLKDYHFNFVALGHCPLTVKERLYEIERESLVFDDMIEDTKAKIAVLLKEELRLMVVYDYLKNIKQRQEAEGTILKQRFTFALTGWIKRKNVGLLNGEMCKKFKDIALFVSEPGPDDDIPVDLENPPIIQPFEFITKIYGFPKYNELDPTPYLAPFFFVYFGFCVSDVGYGFILSLFSFFVLRRFKMGPQGLRFFKLFFLCGISTMIVGALTGSWFGNILDLASDANRLLAPLKTFKDSLILLDPMKEPTKLLGIALSFGIIQVWFGNIVAAIGNAKNKRYLDILLDQAPTLTLLFGLTGLGVIFLRLAKPTYITIFKYAALIGSIGLILTQGRNEKGVGSKLFFGVYNLYNALSGYLSDILSYSRLWALGLVTGVMATTINLISIQFSQIFVSFIPFVDKIGFIKVFLSTIILLVIFVSGHLVSFLMNLLGAFVHPVRLQFVEFFSKFFKSGGNAFKPFRVETKYINIE